MITQRVIAPFWRRRWLILTTTLAVLTGTLFWARGLPRVYESSLTLVANSKDGSTIPPGQLARLRQDLWSNAVIYPVVESDLFRAERASGVRNDALVEQLQHSTDLTEHAHGSSTVVHLRYLDPRPERAQAIASVLGETIQKSEAKNTVEGAVVFRVEEPARPAPGTIEPRIHIIALFAVGRGIFLGLVLACLSALVGSWRQRRQPELNSPVV
jgi:uncharacterized protein involved in exopolysaccharide biosynthesis